MTLARAICCWTAIAGVALAADGTEPGVAFLLKGLQHPAPVVRARAAAELRSRGEPAALALAATLQQGNLLTATKAAAVLVQMRDEAQAAMPVLLDVLRDEQAGEWRWDLAIRSLQEIGADAQRAALPFAIRALDGNQPLKQRGAIELVMQLKGDAAAAAGPLRRLLHRSRRPFRSVIVRDSVIDENLVAFTEEAPIYDDLLILDAMRQVGVPESELSPVLTKWAENVRPGVRLLAATQLAALGPKSKTVAGTAFAQLLEDTSPGIRETAVVELAKLGPAGAAATGRLCRLLRDRDPKLREQAATALGEIGPAAGARSVRALEDAIQIERLLADSPGLLSAMARQRAELMAAALEKVRKSDLE